MKKIRESRVLIESWQGRDLGVPDEAVYEDILYGAVYCAVCNAITFCDYMN